MKFSKPISELIRERHSSRNYSNENLTITEVEKIQNELLKYNSNNYFFKLVKEKKSNMDYLLGIITNKHFSNIQFGYTFEIVVLFCTDLGLGTCWTGLFNKMAFSSCLDKKTFQKIGFISPVGYSEDFTSKKGRKPWSELFFNEKNQPLNKNDVQTYHEAIEMVRLAPSGMNLQPWRIIYYKNKYHFFVERKKGIVALAFKTLAIDIQLVDMGIAMCHFELYANENGLIGKWSKESSINHPDDWQYINTWIQISNK
ncbi:MAG: hypothetical protein KAH01_07885 [Caldisericia bacterium]|nr:hypothetical protein [Caldisericia bacterium]